MAEILILALVGWAMFVFGVWCIGKVFSPLCENENNEKKEEAEA